MTSTKKDPVVVVLQLTGGNDYMNTVIPLQRRPLLRKPAECRLSAGGDAAPERQPRPDAHDGPGQGTL